jgi:hypothetical protein
MYVGFISAILLALAGVFGDRYQVASCYYLPGSYDTIYALACR